MITMEKQKLKDALIRLSVLKNVDISDKVDKIVNAKTILDVGFRCPCCPDDREMACISKKCYNEIQQNGVCHCGLFKKKYESKV